MQQGDALTARDEVGSAQFGFSVSLSGNGDTALIGGPDDRTLRAPGSHAGYGAAWVFTRTGTTWRQQGPKLTGRHEPPYGDFGLQVALAGDAATALVGSYAPASGRGAAWIFSRTGSTWKQQGDTLSPHNETGPGEFGGAVALSANGRTALISGIANSAAWVFSRFGTSWVRRSIRQEVTLRGDGEIGRPGFGSAVALSGSGTIALVGAWADNNFQGAVWKFTREGNYWAGVDTKITQPVDNQHAAFGEAIAISADGRTALVGGPEDHHNRGGAWIITLTN
jgi:hypothetical protein